MPDNKVDQVRCDTQTAAEAITRYLIGLGHRHLAMLSGPQEIVSATERADGFRAAIRRAKLPLRQCPVEFGKFDPHSGYEMARALLETSHRPTALVTANNFIALGAARAAQDLGIRIPEDVSIVTFDGARPEYVYDPFFTGVYQPTEEMGRTAAELLFRRIVEGSDDEPRDIVLPTRVETYSSTAAPPA
jgi:DNA-binding LacI/PurR family transcriptional regulator